MLVVIYGVVNVKSGWLSPANAAELVMSAVSAVVLAGLGKAVLSGHIRARTGAAIIAFIVILIGYVAWTVARQSKSYYVTIKELQTLNGPYSKRLRVAGSVVPGSIRLQGTRLEFQLKEDDRVLPVAYQGTEAPPDTFKDECQAMAEGTYGQDGVFHAGHLQVK
jgi:cytochrome c-type biogenesis protein CcmE